ncbi:MAG: FAD-linked oxidase C-terminal domain-containing protein [Desulfosarcinaceae bacterium]|nr:FAD-linked oxidase C-terminal domain-containing protein [Desulfosarcinaceae bacterium]
MDSIGKAREALVNDLEKAVCGEVYADTLTRHLYSTDASDYCKVPVGVVVPRHLDDIQAAVAIAARHGVPVIPRGGGSNLSGQTVGTGLIMDHSKYLDKVLEIQPQERWVRVEAGAVLDAVNAALAAHGLMVGPDPSSSMVATMGGMAGNNSTGAHSCRYGMLGDYIQEMTVILADGSRARLGPVDTAATAALARRDTLEGRLYQRIPEILAAYGEEIETGYPHTWRSVAGYRLNQLMADRKAGLPFNLAPLLAGSEGSLAVIGDLKLRVVPRPGAVNLMVLHFPGATEALEMVPAILDHQPAAAELMTAPSILLADAHPLYRRRLRRFVQGNPGAILIVEFAEATPEELAGRLSGFGQWLQRAGYRQPLTHCDTTDQVANVWSLRKAVFGLLLSKPRADKPIWIIDDPSVPVERLAAYTQDVVALGRRYGLEINFDAHASAGCLHMGLKIDLKTRAGLRTLELLAHEILDVVLAHHGSSTGEHGEGLARSYFNEKLFGPRLHQAFKAVKRAFDPDGRLNPHKILDPIAPWDTGWLRYHPDYRTPLAPAQTHLDFSAYGGFAGLVEMCNGMGICRSMSAGTMCPSYRATKAELHSTRGRANALRAAITGGLGPMGLGAEALHRAMDLCLACKACRSECAAKVDMAKLKVEFLAHYQSVHGIPLRSRAIAALPQADAVASKAPRLANRLYRSAVFRRILERGLGIDRRRRLPLLSAETFQQWYRRRKVGAAPNRGDVILWDDCHLSYHEPWIGRAAVAVLEAAGYRVIVVPGRRCCGRPHISKGLLDRARSNARHNVALLLPHIRRGVPLIGVEPSCIACFRDEYPDLLKSEAAREVAAKAYFFEEFIAELAAAGELRLRFTPQPPRRTIRLHTHCYQKAFGTAEQVVALLELVPNADVEEIAAGCCGMAGAFGFEQEHYEISMAIGEAALFPSVRTAAPETLIAAAGTSCRQQITDGTGRRAQHPIQILSAALAATPL